MPNLHVNDYGDVTYTIPTPTSIENLKNWSDVVACNNALSNKVKSIIESDQLCLTLGGDHSVALGSVDGHSRALQNREIAVLWVDAHADINTNNSSPSGNCHGMPLSLLIKELKPLWPTLLGLEWHEPQLPVRNLAYIGLRSLETFEKETIHKYGIAAFGMEDVERYGVNAVVKMAMKKIDPYSSHSIHVSFDIDALDPLEAPCTGCPGNY